MATKMEPSLPPPEFLSGDGIDLNPQNKIANTNAVEPDDLDLLLSEITVQFDDEVQTLYIGPVEIVDDDVKSYDNKAYCFAPEITQTGRNLSETVPGCLELASNATKESVDSVISTRITNFPEGVDSLSNNNVENSPTHSTVKSNERIKLIEKAVAIDDVIEILAVTGQISQHEQIQSVSLPVMDCKSLGGERVEEMVNITENDRPHHLTEVVNIDRKDGGESQTVFNKGLRQSKSRKYTPLRAKATPEASPEKLVKKPEEKEIELSSTKQIDTLSRADIATSLLDESNITNFEKSTSSSTKAPHDNLAAPIIEEIIDKRPVKPLVLYNDSITSTLEKITTAEIVSIIGEVVVSKNLGISNIGESARATHQQTAQVLQESVVPIPKFLNTPGAEEASDEKVEVSSIGISTLNEPVEPLVIETIVPTHPDTILLSNTTLACIVNKPDTLVLEQGSGRISVEPAIARNENSVSIIPEKLTSDKDQLDTTLAKEAIEEISSIHNADQTTKETTLATENVVTPDRQVLKINTIETNEVLNTIGEKAEISGPGSSHTTLSTVQSTSSKTSDVLEKLVALAESPPPVSKSLQIPSHDGKIETTSVASIVEEQLTILTSNETSCTGTHGTTLAINIPTIAEELEESSEASIEQTVDKTNEGNEQSAYSPEKPTQDVAVKLSECSPTLSENNSKATEQNVRTVTNLSLEAASVREVSLQQNPAQTVSSTANVAGIIQEADLENQNVLSPSKEITQVSIEAAVFTPAKVPVASALQKSPIESTVPPNKRSAKRVISASPAEVVDHQSSSIATCSKTVTKPTASLSKRRTQNKTTEKTKEDTTPIVEAINSAPEQSLEGAQILSIIGGNDTPLDNSPSTTAELSILSPQLPLIQSAETICPVTPVDKESTSTTVVKPSFSPVKQPCKKSVSPRKKRRLESPNARVSKTLKISAEHAANSDIVKEETRLLYPTFSALAEPENDIEDDDESSQGELIVPDILEQADINSQRHTYSTEYNKDSSPTGSDSGIENETAEVRTVVVQVTGEHETVCEFVINETEINIPDDSIQDSVPAQTDIQDTQVHTIHVNSKKSEPKTGARLIKCAKCIMTFKRELWYKKHLMNYHGIDLNSIAHFLSNLQTLDESIPDGDRQNISEQYDEFQLESSPINGESTDNVQNNEEPSCTSQGQTVLRSSDISATSSPATLQMYPEVKLTTTAKTKTKPRRRKEKLIPINSDATVNIKHEYIASLATSEESTSGSASHLSQPLLNNMYVVKYIEQTSFVAGNVSSPGAHSPIVDSNKENSKSSQHIEPLLNECNDDLTPYERAKITDGEIDGSQLYTCNICDAHFEERQAAQDHVNFFHKDVKRRTCPHCGRTFAQTGDLTRHVRIHTGIRPFKCPFEGCHYAFISSGDLHKHVRRHNQLVNPIPKPHVCQICGKDFERGYDLKRHSSMHAKDDPNFQGFNCDLCGKTFARKDQYRAHTYRHIGYKPHTCVHCMKCFSDASNYAKHLKIHELDGVLLYCHHCDKPFKNKMAISKHVFYCKYKTLHGTRKKLVKNEPVEISSL